MKWVAYVVLLFYLCYIVQGLKPLDDPYKILGVKRAATLQEIRKAYKQLAREWHPDKNDNPAAANKFVEISQAYELLNDPERRKQFDNHGIINPDAVPRQRRESNIYEFEPFEEMFNFRHDFKFRYQEPDITLFHKLSITSRAFENNLLPKSMRTPHLIFFYSDWCFACLKIEPIWRRVIEELEPIGIEMATAHSETEHILVRKCGISGVPSLVFLIEGRIYVYKESLYSVQKIVEFVRRYFPYKLITNINSKNINDFLNGWHDNKIRCLLFQKQEMLRLRYLVVAFYFKQRASFGFVNMADDTTKPIQDKYQITSDNTDTLLLFNENTVRPVASLSMSVIPVQTMKHVITANKYLILPRLSSQSVLDAICPVEWARPRKRLCVVLVSENTPFHDEPRQAMREFAQQAGYSMDRVRFSYIYQEKQPEFINAISAGSPVETVLNVVIIWRRDMNHINYEWMKGGWIVNSRNNSPEWNMTKETLETTIARLLKVDETLSYEAVVKELIDEHAQGLFGRMLFKLYFTLDVLQDNIEKEHVLVTLSVIGTIVFIVVIGYFMAYLLRLEEEKIKKSRLFEDESTNNNKVNGVSYTPQLRLHELRAEKYNGMVRLLKPGCRTIVLLLDTQSKAILLPIFHKIVWPYRKNKTLMFGFMCIERGVDWYKKLLTLSLPEPRELHINPRNCIGTVLSLNGHRKYFCMYHAKHPESFLGRGSKRMMKMTKTLGGKEEKVNNGSIGGFMGFESSDSDSDNSVDVEQGKPQEPVCVESNLLLQENLLDGLPNWLDRLFEGTTHRYHINFWPDFPTK